MSISVNNKTIDWKENETVSGLLKRMNYIFPLIIVKVNGKLIPRSDFNEYIIPDNSKIDAIHLISGG